MNKDKLTTVCLLGAAILVWLTIVSVIVGGVTTAYVLTHNATHNATHNSTSFKTDYTDRYGNKCWHEDVDLEMNCP